MIDFGRLRHLSPPQIKVLQAANRGLRRSAKTGTYVMPVDNKPVNFAESLFPQLSVKHHRDPLQPRLLGCKVMGGEGRCPLWYSNVTRRVEKAPTYLYGGFARSLRKIEALLRGHEADCAVMTTAERRDRALARFPLVVMHKDPVPTHARHLIVDEAHLLSKGTATKIGEAALESQYKWVVSPHSDKVAERAMLLMGLASAAGVPSFGTMLTEPRSLNQGTCPICLEDKQRLATVCDNGHECCLTCSPYIKGRCMLCRQKTKSYI